MGEFLKHAQSLYCCAEAGMTFKLSPGLDRQIHWSDNRPEEEQNSGQIAL